MTPGGGRLHPPARPAGPGRPQPRDMDRGDGPGIAAPQVPQRGGGLLRPARPAPGCRPGGACRLSAQAEKSARQAVAFDYVVTFSAPKSVTVMDVAFER